MGVIIVLVFLYCVIGRLEYDIATKFTNDFADLCNTISSLNGKCCHICIEVHAQHVAKLVINASRIFIIIFTTARSLSVALRWHLGRRR